MLILQKWKSGSTNKHFTPICLHKSSHMNEQYLVNHGNMIHFRHYNTIFVAEGLF